MSKKDPKELVFWPTVGVIAVSFGMAIYTAVTSPEKEGPQLVKPGEGSSLPAPATPDSP